MMKKLLTTAFCVSMITFGMQAANANNSQPTAQKYGPRPPYAGKEFKKPMPKFDEALNLTDKQKEQARQNRIAGRKEMKPIMDEIRNKKEAILDVMDSDLPEAQKKEQIKALQGEIKTLSVKANEIREKNMADFEKILTKEQKAKLNQMKQERRKPHGCAKCKIQQPKPIPED